MKIKAMITAFVIVSMIFGVNQMPKAITEERHNAADIDTHWAEEEISTLMYADILKGYQGNANPDAVITRGQFTALTARTLGLEGKSGQAYDDIPPSHMFFSEITAATDAGIVNGVGKDTFLPEKPITREEIMLIISRCTSSPDKSPVSFKDIDKSYPYKTELGRAVATGIIKGFDDGTFRPKNNATRAECSAMLVRLLKSYESISKSDISSLAEEYIKNDLNDVSENLSLTTGRANYEISLKKKAVKTMSEYSAQVQKIPHKIKQTKISAEGALASAEYTGDVTYLLTTLSDTRQRTYLATYKLDMIYLDGELHIYNCDMSLKKKDKINLTWEVYSSPPDYAPKGVNVVSPSSFQISKENLGVESNPLTQNTKFYNSLTRKYMDYARMSGYEVWPIYKTDFSLKTSDELLNNSSLREKSAEYLIRYACKYMTDGINIDFENVYAKNRHLLSQHVRELSVMLHELGLIVSVDITRLEPTSANWSMCYDRDALSKNADYIMLMAYDEHYASSPTAGSVASLDWTENSIERTLNEVPHEKLVLGIPFYMRYFELSGNKVISSKAISMSTAYDLINSNNVSYTYIESDRQYKISWKNGSKTCVFWLENSDTVKDRMSLIKKYSLAGVASWRRGLEINKVWDVIMENL